MSQIPRIYLGDQLVSEQSIIVLDEQQSHYLVRVLRLKSRDQVKLLGKAGEWLAEIEVADKKHASARATKQLRSYVETPDIWLLFAPVKHEKVDFLARRAVELGARRLCPIKTDYTQNSRINMGRLQSNLVEAAEQCSRMDVPEVAEYQPLESALDGWNASRTLFFCDESGGGQPLHQQVQTLKRGASAAICIGPEGGFSPAERNLLASKLFVKPSTLGPRILRAETAALVALTHLTAWLGDGDKQPHFVAT